MSKTGNALILPFIITILSGCYGSAIVKPDDRKLMDSDRAQHESGDTNTKPDEALKRLGLMIGAGSKIDVASVQMIKLHNDTGLKITRAGGFYASFEKQSAGWKLTGISGIRPSVTDFSRQEVLYFSKDIKSVEPDFRTFIPAQSNGDFQCWTGVLRSRKANATTDYNPCESSLTTMSHFDTAAQVMFTTVTLGLFSATGTSSRQVVVDKEKVLGLIQETGTLEQLQKIKAELEISTYRKAFVSATTLDQLNEFINKYSGHDPENLIPNAIKRRDELHSREMAEKAELEISTYRKAFVSATTLDQLNEFINKYSGHDPENLIPNAIKRRDELHSREMAEDKKRRLREEKQMRQKMARVASFRQTLKVETETNCGPVVEIKGNLVKIYSPVANYGNEHWLKKDELFPSDYGCSFFNGNYVPPSAY
jgi:hypothetical protein